MLRRPIDVDERLPLLQSIPLSLLFWGFDRLGLSNDIDPAH